LNNGGLLQNKKVGDTCSQRKKELAQAQILIGESDNELLLLFRTYLSSLGIGTETASSGQEALDYFLQSKEKRIPYEAILLDTHLYNPSGLDVAKKIRSEKPDQKLVLVTTTPKKHLSEECLRTTALKDIDVLTMPFKLAKLATVLRH
jgi:two-component system, OmpR family, response regulator